MPTFCAYYNQSTCRSCTYLEIDYASQIRDKEQVLQNTLGELLTISLSPTATSALTHFRNKVKVSVTGNWEHPIIGLLGETRLDEGKEILACPVHHPEINSVLKTIKSFITNTRLAPYHIESRRGELKGLIIFHSEKTNETYLRFVLRSKESLDRIKKNIPSLISQHPSLKSISLNLQPIPHAILEGEEEIFLGPQDFIRHEIGNITAKLRPQAFVQTNSRVAESLYLTAASWIQDEKINKFMELFCGKGAFTLLSAPFVDSALGVEINTEAVLCAQETAKERGLSHVNFKALDAADAEKILHDFQPDLLLVNPPRRGLGKSLDYLKKSHVPQIIYSSCSHETLASDLRALSEKYHIKKIQIFDMFPHTSHFETLVHLIYRR